MSMNMKARELYIKTYDYVLDEKGIEVDKYERDDALTALLDIHNGKDPVNSFIHAFSAVHDIEISEDYFLSRLAICGGFKWKEILDNKWIYERYLERK